MRRKLKRTRRRPRRNIGKYTSNKMGMTFTHRSGWELSYFKYLEDNTDVVKYYSEVIRIPYVSNLKTGRLRTYIPDLLVEWSDGRKELIEIKPIRRVTNPKNIKKFVAASAWCAENGVKFVIITEKDLKSLKLI